MNTPFLMLYLLAVVLISITFFYLFRTASKTIEQVQQQPHPNFQTHHWGYGWRSWWPSINERAGLPGVSTLPPNTIPKPPKPYIVKT